MRPNTLAVATKYRKHMDTQKFISEALQAWRTKARCNIVPAERLHELFEELKFNPTEKQINEMLQTAKLFARRGNNGTTAVSSRHMNGLTFGEFCVLAADLKRFRIQSSQQSMSSYRDCISHTPDMVNESVSATSTARSTVAANEQSKDELKPSDGSSAPEVFLGGSCNPTTWRADVAMPTLRKCGISFYNPQVSDWTPDLIELEHRAKEKARVLFFVMDSETRASAGAIEAAYIAGQNTRHLVLVLHPYKQDQCILNEQISTQEYLDLKRNQQLLRELVSRRGLPVLDDVLSGLQQTRAILTGAGFSVPQNIAAKLIAVRRAFDRALEDKSSSTSNEQIALEQCQCALSFLGYAQNLLHLDNLVDIVKSHRDISQTNHRFVQKSEILIDFEEFCVLTSYLTILQEEISESGCVSPIKGTNLPPPPIFLTNRPEWLHNHTNELHTPRSKHTHRSSSSKNVLEEKASVMTVVGSDAYRNHRDSGTSSPIHPEARSIDAATSSNDSAARLINGSRSALNVEHSTAPQNQHIQTVISSDDAEEELSDSNDSVFSSDSSIDSILNYTSPADHLMNDENAAGIEAFDLRDIYLGGSCALRTNWRQEIVIPMLNEHHVTYHLPQLHSSLSQNGECDNGYLTPQRSIDESTAASSSAALETSSSNDSGISTGQSRSGLRLHAPYNYNRHAMNGTNIDHNVSSRRMFHLSLLDSSRVLLFVITNETRSLAPMTLAAHCIGLGYNVVLCVQMLSDGCTIGQDQLTPVAIKDYNRGRSYLIDLAKRQEVPVFNDIKKAVECAIEKVKLCKCRDTV